MKSTFKLAIGDNESTKNQKGKAPTTKTSQTPAHGNTIPDSTPTSAMFEQLLQKVDRPIEAAAETPPTPGIQPQIAGFPFTPHAPIVSQQLYPNRYPPETQMGTVPQVHVLKPASGAGWELGSDRIA